jgi:hypothetical protein
MHGDIGCARTVEAHELEHVEPDSSRACVGEVHEKDEDGIEQSLSSPHHLHLVDGIKKDDDEIEKDKDGGINRGEFFLGR